MNDLHVALRSLRKSPGFTIVAVVTLALGIGANTAIFSTVDAVLFRPLPFHDAGRLVLVGEGLPILSTKNFGTLSDADYLDYHRLDGSIFESSAAFEATAETLTGNGAPEWLTGLQTAPSLLHVLGLRPALGRDFQDADAAPGAPDVVLLSDALWHRRFGGDPGVIGRAVVLDGQPTTVIGVLPPEMKLRYGGPQQDVWIPAPVGWIPRSTWGGIVLLKLKRGWTWAAAHNQLIALARRLTLEYGSGPVPYAFSLIPILPDPLHLRPIHVALAGAALLVLLIACVNLASLMLVRGIAKRRELALRMAIGAGRATLVRQLFAESALVAAVGTALGVVLTVWAIALLYHHMPPSVTALAIARPHASWRVFVAGLGLVGATLVLFGLWPAVRASDVDVSEPLKETSPSATGRNRGRYSLLVVTEVALSLVLLMGATLLTRAAESRTDAMAGLDRTGLLDALIWTGRGEPGVSVARNLQTRVAAVPGVQSVATYAYAGGAGGGTAMSEAYDGHNGLATHTSVLRVGDGFLRTLGIRVLRGRAFLPGDERSAVAIVDEAAARWLWPDGQAVGRAVKLGGPTSNGPWYRVVGVARTAPAAGLPEASALQNVPFTSSAIWKASPRL